MIHCVLHDPDDSVAVVVVEGIKAGTTLTGLILDEDRTIDARCAQDIPIGHKVALKDMAVGDTVIKYGVDIGKVVQPITQGRACARAQHQDQALVDHEDRHDAIHSGDTAARTAASACATTSSSCRSTICRTRRPRRSRNNIKGTLAIPHPYGRLQFGADLDLHFRTLIGTGSNPNVAAVVVIGIEDAVDEEGRRRHRRHRQAGAGLRHRAARRPRHDHARVEGGAGIPAVGERAAARRVRAARSCGCRPSAANPTRRRAAAPIRRSATRSTSSTRRAARWSSARRPS